MIVQNTSVFPPTVIKHEQESRELARKGKTSTFGVMIGSAGKADEGLYSQQSISRYVGAQAVRDGRAHN